MNVTNFMNLLQEEYELKNTFRDIKNVIYNMKLPYLLFVHKKVAYFCELMGIRAPKFDDLEYYYLSGDTFVIEYSSDPYSFYFPKEVIGTYNRETMREYVTEHEEKLIKRFKKR